MKKKTVLTSLIIAMALLLGGAGVLYGRLSEEIAVDQLAAAQEETARQSENEETEQKVAAPDFVVYDENGMQVRLADYAGKPVVLNFWASWCGPCQMEMPDFQRQYLEMGEDVHFLMVNMTDGARETVDRASEFVREKGYTFPVFYDTQASAAQAYSVYSLPTTYFIDAQGHAIAQATGAINRETLQRGIEMIIDS